MAWRAWSSSGPHRVTTSGRHSATGQSALFTHHTFLHFWAVLYSVRGSCAMCRMPYCRVPVCVVCYCGQLCRVRPNDFLRTQTRGMLPCLELPGQPHFHTRPAHNECLHKGYWAPHWTHWALEQSCHWALEQSQLAPRLPNRVPPGTTAVPTLLLNRAQCIVCASFTVGTHGK